MIPLCTINMRKAATKPSWICGSEPDLGSEARKGRLGLVKSLNSIHRSYFNFMLNPYLRWNYYTDMEKAFDLVYGKVTHWVK